MAPIRMAPPTPTQTPMIIFFELLERPESLSLDSVFRPGESDEVVESEPLVPCVAAAVVVKTVGTPVPLTV